MNRMLTRLVFAPALLIAMGATLLSGIGTAFAQSDTTPPIISHDAVSTNALATDFEQHLGTVNIDTVVTITLEGDSPVTVAHGDTYTEAEDAGVSGAERQDTTAVTTTRPDATTVNGIAVDTNTPGDYTITYTVSDRAGNVSNSVTRTVTVNQPVVANAGLDQRNVDAGATVTLDGSGSTGDGLTYEWTVPAASGGTISLSSTTAVSLTFTAPTQANDLVFTLTVTDSANAAATDRVTILVSPADSFRITLAGDTGIDGDGITSNGVVNVSNPGGSWTYSVDGGTTPSAVQPATTTSSERIRHGKPAADCRSGAPAKCGDWRARDAGRLRHRVIPRMVRISGDMAISTRYCRAVYRIVQRGEQHRVNPRPTISRKSAGTGHWANRANRDFGNA